MAATALWQSQSGLMDNKSIASLYSRTFDKIVEKKEGVPREGAQFYATEHTNLDTFKMGEVVSTLEVPQRNEDTDDIPILAAKDGFNKEWTNVQRRSAVMVTRRAIKAQKTRMLASLMTGLPNSQAVLEELCYASLLNNGWASETTGDGSYIFATDHYLENTEFGQYANKAASGSAFDTDSYLAGWLNLDQRITSEGTPDPKTPSELVYRSDIHEDVMKVAGSDKYPQNSLNAKMPELFGQFKPVRMHWITSTTAWYIHAKAEQPDRGFIIVWQDKPNYAPISNPMNPELIMGRRLLVSFSVGALHGRDWYANAGA